MEKLVIPLLLYSRCGSIPSDLECRGRLYDSIFYSGGIRLDSYLDIIPVLALERILGSFFEAFLALRKALVSKKND